MDNQDHTTREQAADSLAAKAALLHTYTSDVQDVVRREQVSIVKAIAAEADKEREGAADAAVKKSSKLMLLASAALIILGGLALTFAYIAYTTQKAALTRDQAQALASDSMIFIEHRASLDVTDRTPREVRSQLNLLRQNSPATLGSVTDIQLQKKVWDAATRAYVLQPLTAGEVIAAFGFSLPSTFTQYLGSQYLLGVYTTDANAPFLLFTTSSHDHTFNDLLNWEGHAEAELAPLFSVPGSGSAQRTVEDITVQNISARAIRDDAQNLHLLYAFLDNNTFIITNNINTLTEVARRYQVRKSGGTARQM